MNETVEITCQWHQGRSIEAIERSFGRDHWTARKYVRSVQSIGVCRDRAFQLERELVSQLRSLNNSRLVREKPAGDLIAPDREWIEGKLKVSEMAAKQVCIF